MFIRFRSIKTILAPILLVTFLLATFSCKEEESAIPTNLPPQVELTGAYNITRNEATVSGSVTPVGSGHICFISLRYGVTDSLEHELSFKTSERSINARLTGLQTETTYRCVLETGNEYSTITSDTLRFTTTQGISPILSPLSIAGRGPYRIALQSLITDDGGLPITETGFYYWPEGREEEKKKQKFSSPQTDSPTEIQDIIRLLKKDCPYQAQAYATNKAGEATSQPFAFTVNDSLTLTEAGTLADHLTTEEQDSITSLTLKGPINGSDTYVLHLMTGSENGTDDFGNLTYLDLTETDIRMGGVYPNSWTIQNNYIDGRLFYHSRWLEVLKLPATLKYFSFVSIEGCAHLRHITFPRDMESYYYYPLTVRQGTINIESFDIPDDAPYFCTYNGALYNKAENKLVWYPPCRDTARAESFMPGVSVTSGMAFMDSQLKYLELPKGIRTLKDQSNVIMEKLEYLSMPDSISYISWRFNSGLFPNLKTLYWGKGATRISITYFHFPETLRQIYVPQSTPPNLTENYDGGISEIKDSCTLYVPIGATAAYREAEHWKDFTNIVEMEFE